MKVIHVINDLFAYGGTPKKLRYLVKYANTDKYNHVFICINKAEILEEFSGLPVKIYNADGSLLRALSLVKAEIVKGNTIICVHFFKAFIAGAIASVFYRVPLVNNEHGSAYYRTGYKKYVMQLLRFVPKVTICNSKYVLGTIAKQFKFPKNKLVVVYNPVEKRLSGKSLIVGISIDAKSLVIGHVGGFIKQRDQIILIDAISCLRKKGIDAILILIGDGPEKNNLEKKCEELGVNQYVNFVGYTNDIGDWLDLFDIYINPTLDEGFGIAVVEAMLSDIPVIAANAGAHKEIIEDNINGLLFSPSDLESLIEKIMILYNDPESCKKITSHAHEIAEKKYSPLLYSNNYHDVINKVVLNRE